MSANIVNLAFKLFLQGKLSSKQYQAIYRSYKLAQELRSTHG